MSKRLPVEVLHSILEMASSRQTAAIRDPLPNEYGLNRLLLDCSLVCKQWSLVALHLLYRDIYTVAWHIKTPFSGARYAWDDEQSDALPEEDDLEDDQPPPDRRRRLRGTLVRSAFTDGELPMRALAWTLARLRARGSVLPDSVDSLWACAGRTTERSTYGRLETLARVLEHTPRVRVVRLVLHGMPVPGEHAPAFAPAALAQIARCARVAHLRVVCASGPPDALFQLLRVWLAVRTLEASVGVQDVDRTRRDRMPDIGPGDDSDEQEDGECKPLQTLRFRGQHPEPLLAAASARCARAGVPGPTTVELHCDMALRGRGAIELGVVAAALRTLRLIVPAWRIPDLRACPRLVDVALGNNAAAARALAQLPPSVQRVALYEFPEWGAWEQLCRLLRAAPHLSAVALPLVPTKAEQTHEMASRCEARSVRLSHDVAPIDWAYIDRQPRFIPRPGVT